jgi:hypothetical protein
VHLWVPFQALLLNSLSRFMALLVRLAPLLFWRYIPTCPLLTRICKLVMSLLPMSCLMMNSPQMCSIALGPMSMVIPLLLAVSSSMLTNSTWSCQCWMMIMTTTIILIHCCHLCLSGLLPLLLMLLTFLFGLLNSQSHTPTMGPYVSWPSST